MSTIDPAAAEPQTAAPSSRPRVAILFGGRSSEHAVSCATAAGVLRAIDRDAYDELRFGGAARVVRVASSRSSRVSAVAA